MAKRDRIHPVILAGGSGTRFWPLSRKRRPKQLLPLASSEPLISDTFARLEGLAAPRDVLVVCGRSHARALRGMLPDDVQVLVEPQPRNTAAAIGLAATVVAAKDPKGVLAVLPSDHAVLDRRAFHRTLREAAKVAAGGSLVTIGITPTRPETGFGYIRVGEDHPAGGNAKRVRSFVEKPDRDTASRYVISGDYLWNAGMFVFRADRMLDEIERHLPECAEVLAEIAKAVGTAGFDRALSKWFPSCPSISIDYAVMERADDIAVIPASFGWSDLGSFASLPEVRPADHAGNVVQGDILAFGATGNVVVGHPGKPVALVGCSNLVVIDTGDALLVCDRERAQEIRQVVEALEKRGDRRLL
ncbi:MAG TPA: mannose-1-phosphate guanylyltransferase [Vulgatibacter sp.]|nr:mannose-1-phosphate guanylyltransferase [Vulgatibacter sp.]